MDVRPLLRRQSGMMLMESLVAVLVLAIGMLGVAALHVNSLANSQSALFRTRAIFLAADLVERMTLNRSNIEAYNGWDVPAASATGTTFNPLTGTDVAGVDMQQWGELLHHRDYGLPQGQATITVTADSTTTSSHNVVIVIQWQENSETSQYRLVSIVNSAI